MTTSWRLRDLDADYSDDRGVHTLWSSYTSDGAGYTEITRVFHPLTWGLGVEAQRQVAGYHDPHMFWIYLTIGPWSLGLRREWPGDRDEFAVWSRRRRWMLETDHKHKTWSDLWVDEDGNHDWRICPCESCVHCRNLQYGRKP